MKGHHDRAAMGGWHNRNLHYAKELPTLSDYLQPLSAAEKRETGAANVLALFNRIAQNQKGHSDGNG